MVDNEINADKVYMILLSMDLDSFYDFCRSFIFDKGFKVVENHIMTRKELERGRFLFDSNSIRSGDL